MNKLFVIIVILFQFAILSAADTVVCLHGFFRSYRCMMPLGNMLRDEGFNVVLWDYNGRRKTIEELAAYLVKTLNQIAAARPGEPIHFVTHSLGGVIVRAALNHPACPEEAKFGKAVLLAPPNKGAALARHFRDSLFVNWLFGQKAGKQLLLYGETEMDCFGQFPTMKEVLVIAGCKGSPFFSRWLNEPNDGKVMIKETCLATPHWHCVHYVSHSWIMTSRYTLQIIKAFLCSEKNLGERSLN